jgi:hypothetical protein
VNCYEVKLECGWPGQHGFATYTVNVDDREEPESEAESKARARARREHLCVVSVVHVRRVGADE